MYTSIPHSLRNRWNALSRRERQLVATAAAIALFALLYVLAWQPMRNATQRVAQDLPRLQQQAARMRAQADAIAALSPPNADIPEKAASSASDLRALAARAQVAASLGQVERSDNGRVRLPFNPVSGDALMRFLQLAQVEARWRITEMQISRLSGGDSVRAEITLTP